MNAILFRDLLMNMALGLTAVCIALLLAVKPVTSDDQGKQPGNMVITAVWPSGPIDVDLWVKGPNEKIAVGYSNRAGRVFNLLRDDLGTMSDDLPLNYENSYSRGLPAGEYTVNLHYYRGVGDVPVAVEIRFGQTGQQAKLYLQETIGLRVAGQERTVVTFRLDEHGNVTGSNRIFKPLRAVGKVVG